MTAHNRPFWRRLAQAAAAPATIGTAASAHATHAGLASAMRPLALEQRFMFDGAAVDASADAAHAGAAAFAADGAHGATAVLLVPQAVEVRAAHPALDGGKKEVVLVDTSVADYKTLEAGVRDGVGIVEFDGSADGLAQIAAWAATQSNYDAIHILSHGSEGVLNLGTLHLSQSSLASENIQQELAQLGQALASDGDLLLYGCDVAAGTQSSALLQGLAQATGADVAASSDATGAATKGGNWTLETHVGQIEAEALRISEYQDLLTQVTITRTDANGSNNQFTKSIDNVIFTFSGGDPADGTFLGIDATFGPEGLYADDLSTGGTKLTITIQPGYTFDLSGLDVASAASSLTIEYFDTNNQSHQLYPGTGIGAWQSISGLDSTVNDVIKLVITSNDLTNFQNFNFTDIKAIPPAAVVNSAMLSADTGSNYSDFITKVASQTITGTLSAALGTGESVQVSYDNGVSWSNATSYTVGSNSWSATTTLAGSSTFQARVINGNGGSSTAYTHSYTLDTTVPSTTISSVSFSNDSGSFSNDFITNVASQTISGTLSANVQSGEAVYVSIDNGATWTAANATVGQNSWSLAGVTLSTSNTLHVKVSDAAGNDGTVRFQSYTYDTTVPSTSFSGLTFSNDSGMAGDFVTNHASQTITATLSAGLVAGDILYGSLDGGSTWTDITSKASGTTLSWNGVTLAGSGSLQLRVMDAAGNAGTVTSQDYVLDTSTPSAPSMPTLGGASDTGISNSDGITSDTTPTFTGVAESGSTVNIYDGATLLGSVTATGGFWSYTTTTLSEGSHTITATATDLAGNVSANSAGREVTIDATAPSVNTVTVPVDATYSAGDALRFSVNFSEAVTVDTGGGTPRIALVVGSTTRYASYVSGSGSSTLVFSYTVVNGDTDSNGITVGALSANGGALKDVAGNDATLTLNSVGSTAGVLVDGAQPGITSVSATTSDGSYGAGQTITITVSFSTAVDVSTTNGLPTLALSSGGTASYIGGSGSSTLSFSYTVAAGQNSADLDVASIHALQLNGATISEAGGSHSAASIVLAAPGAAGSLGANKAIVIDTSAPTAAVQTVSFSSDTGSSSSDLVTSNPIQTISGTLSASLGSGEYVEVSLDGGATWAHAMGSVGSDSWSLGVVLVGSGALQVRVVDAAGNTGAVFSRAYALDQSPPTVAISSNVATVNGVTPALITFTFSEPPVGFGAGNITVSGGTLSGLTATSSPWVYTAAFTPASGVASGSATIVVSGYTDAAGNSGSSGFLPSLQIDTVAPSATPGGAVFFNDSGINGDLITNVAAQTISGNLSAPLVAGDEVQISLDNGASWMTVATSIGDTSWSVNTTLNPGSNTLQIRVSDAAGNHSAVYAQAYAYDDTAPTATVVSQQTDSLMPTLTGTSALAAGDSMTVTVGGATYQVTPVSGAWSLDLATAVPISGVLALAADQQYSVAIATLDVAGNQGSSSGTLTIRAQPPTTPVTPSVSEPPIVPVFPSAPAVTDPSLPLAVFPPDMVDTPIPGGPAAPWMLPQSSAGSEGQTPLTVLDTLQSFGPLSPMQQTPDAGLTSAEGFQIVALRGMQGSNALVAYTPIPDVAAISGERIAVQIGNDAFAYADGNAVVTLSARMTDGTPLPGWLRFDARTGRFEGTPPPGFEGTLNFRVTVRDSEGRMATQVFKLVVSKDGSKAALWPGDGSAPAGRASLSEQLRSARSGAAARLAVWS